MGVPKFFRWLSERYPTISQLIAENRIPEFDNLYLDMNGIIHNCTHKDSDSPTFRMSEEQMFIQIFNYIEHLFGKIKPKKLFFMAIDGVAPRAKMNQQRARRFRTALDNEVATKKAIAAGVEMPTEEAFDSNCITPGTAFMAKLTQQLQYFIHKKISEDADWRECEVVLSGHEVPGEGEHKIMEYIRLAKAQPNYDPNVRHCLYGLDADLIMLGLLSHDPHFALLREEVTFGRASKTKSKDLEHQNFYLMHLSIVREYLELEFQELKEPGVIKFGFDMERIIDDFILMAFFVGNDFLPNLPGLHINEGALALMFKIYKDVIQKMDGYINEHGKINLQRLDLLLHELEQFEFRVFEAESDDANWLKNKTKGTLQHLDERQAKGRLVLTPQQKKWTRKIKQWVHDRQDGKGSETFDFPPTLPARDRKFVEDFATALNMQVYTPIDDDGNRYLRLALDLEPNSDSELEEESREALNRVFRKYERASVVDANPEEQQAELEIKYREKFHEWKDQYYKDKLHFSINDEKALTDMCENYVQGLQWVLYYYYRGVASWPWYYKYHYSPKISDVRKGLKADLNFRLGKPFRPFEQLMGVLPDRSKKIVPECYWDLMSSPNSPIIDFYPRDFELDKNGKKQDWEAVVLIPFIEEDRLLKAMRSKEHLLTPAERARNEFGVSLKFSYSPELDFLYPSSMPGVFPDLVHCHCMVNIFELPVLEDLELVVGLCDGVKLKAKALAGFPSLDTLPHRGHLEFHGVNVFQSDSRNESMVITLTNDFDLNKLPVAKEKIGERVFVGYPFLMEARVTAVSDELFKYTRLENGALIQTPHTPFELTAWRTKAERLEGHHSKKLGIVTGPVDIIFEVELLRGMRRTEEGATVKEYGKITGMDTEYAAQTVVFEVHEEDQRFVEKEPLPIEEEFPEGTRAFFLGEYSHGSPLEVIDHANGKANVWVSTQSQEDFQFARKVVAASESVRYYPSFQVARMMKMNSLALSKITSSFSVLIGDERNNLGLNLKFEAKKLKVLGFSRRGQNGWEFSERAVALLQEYKQKFPDFFAGVEKNPHGDIYSDTDFYPPEISKEKMREIKAWLKKLDKLEKVPLDAQQLDGDAVMMVEAAADQLNKQKPPPVSKRVKQVPRNALLKPTDAEHRLSGQRWSLGDRLVYVADSGKVPIATRGTVVGITTSTRVPLLDVVFDIAFMSGTSLGERCSPFRGMTVEATTCLNLTDKQVIVLSKKSQAAAAKQNGTAPQYKVAPPPAPLHGSFSGAVTGAHVNGRGGRGGRGRGGIGHPNAPHLANGHRGGRGGTVPMTLLQRFTKPNGQDAAAGIATQATNHFSETKTEISTTVRHAPHRQEHRAPHRGRGAKVIHKTIHRQEHHQNQQQTTQPPDATVASPLPDDPAIIAAAVKPAAAPAQPAEAPPENAPTGPQKKFNAVPPPDSITHGRGRGRGRGFNRGRGAGRGTGRGGRGLPPAPRQP